ncbi:DNA polymerase beta superfamily protein [Aquibacillus kalidii]|uniref:DNA polymerase beta superfamily protein n=1 Tax=Aquibacillus kalidii TaxID=2762597 RepID=UPI001645793C|nr:nucleotidyltransferase domain-containing protein [Aquibacillus kalidii]
MKKDDFHQLLKEHTIYQVITGSTAYGLANKDSDIDEKAFVILPAPFTLTLGHEWETETLHKPDIEYHSLKKAMNLLKAQNPTLLETLFVDDKFIKKQTSIGQTLRDHRHLFLSQTCYYTFGGYAKDQLKRIKTNLQHQQKLNLCSINDSLKQFQNNMNDKYGPINTQNVIIKRNDKDNFVELSIPSSIPLADINQLTNDLTSLLKKDSHHKKKETDPQRLFKHAMHLVRLLLTGIEVLEAGTLTVYHEQNQLLLRNVRNGDMTWEDIFNLTDNLLDKLEKAKESSSLPEQTDYKKINDLYFYLMSRYYGLGTNKYF